MDPKGLKFREARDSINHPNSFPMQIWADVTGSMSSVLEDLVRNQLGKLMDTSMKHGIQDPAIMPGAIGDQYSDSTPLQVGQFESGNVELDKFLTSIYLEKGGGGDHMESYLLAWLVAARHTSTDHFEKRGRKGVLFTIGDEATHNEVSGAKLCKIMGYQSSEGISAQYILEEAKRTWEVFHIHIQEGDHRDHPEVFRSWRTLLGERFIVVEDYTTIAEVMASMAAMLQGVALSTITKGFDAITAGKINKALSGVNAIVPSGPSSGGIITF
ncbi:MAG: hypothetical protein WC004_03360 [Candidatus Absconditabacterales bacterium]